MDENQTTSEEMTSPTSLVSIRKKVAAFNDKFKGIAAFLKAKKAPPELQIDTATFYVQFYIDKPSLIDLNEIASKPNCDRLGVFFGLDEKKSNKLTVCCIGLGKDGQIINQHRPKGTPGKLAVGEGLAGQEDWPPPPYNLALAKDPSIFVNFPQFTLDTTTQEIQDFLT